MRKLFIILAVFLSLGAFAQKSAFIQAGVAVSNDNFVQELEFGSLDGKNRFSAVGETFNPSGAVDRQYYGGVKYARVIPVGVTTSLVPSGAVKVHLNDGFNDIVLEPGIGLQFRLGEGVALIFNGAAQIHENEKLFNRLALKAGAGLNFSL